MALQPLQHARRVQNAASRHCLNTEVRSWMLITAAKRFRFAVIHLMM